MVVDLAGQEVADHEVVALPDLVHRRRLVHLAGDRHVVVDVERVGVEAAVPADHVERVRRVGHPGPDDAGAGAVLDQHLHVLAARPGTAHPARAGRARSTARARAAARSATGSASAAPRGCWPRSRRAGSARPAPSGAWSRAARSRSRRCGSSAPRGRSRRCRSRPRRRHTRRRSRCGSTATGRPPVTTYPIRTSLLPSTSRRPVTGSLSVASSCSLRWRGLSGWLGVRVWSGSSQTSLPTIADGTPRW